MVNTILIEKSFNLSIEKVYATNTYKSFKNSKSIEKLFEKFDATLASLVGNVMASAHFDM